MTHISPDCLPHSRHASAPFGMSPCMTEDPSRSLPLLVTNLSDSAALGSPGWALPPLADTVIQAGRGASGDGITTEPAASAPGAVMRQRCCFQMLLKLPGFEVLEEGVFHAQIDHQAPKKNASTLLCSRFLPLTSWELRTDYFKSPHFLNCKTEVRNTNSTEQE